MPWFRADLHNHCACDRHDALDYSAQDLLHTAHRLGIHVLAITPHRDIFHDPSADETARRLGIILIHGVEKLISGREIVLLNLPPDCLPPRMTWDDLRALRRQLGPSLLTIAPHPFYPRHNCAGPDLDTHADCIDAVEWCHFYGLGFNPNHAAAAWAARHQKPLLATSDSHHLLQLGRNIQEFEAESPSIPDLFAAIRAGRLRMKVRPYTPADFLTFTTRVAFPNTLRALRRRLSRPAAPPTTSTISPTHSST